MKLNVLLGGASLSVLAMTAIIPAFAQSTGTDTVEETVIVTGTKAKGGLLGKEKVPKARSSVNQEYVKTQAAGQTIGQIINLLPGVNFVNSDPYGSSGGNIRMRGFDGNRISLTQDGIPLNDTGNYASYYNQQIDGELISRATVNLGTTDVDSPTASATGGTINIGSRRPDEEFGVRMTGSYGSFDYSRLFLNVDSGAFGPWGTTAWAAGSYQKYDKFKGPGELEKKQANLKFYQDLGGDGNFVSIAGNYNENRNNFYRNLSLGEIATYGYDFDNFATCTRDAPTNGAIDNDGSGADQNNLANPSSCTNYYGLRINPSNTGNVRMQSSFKLTDSLRLTVDPSFQYTLANGGGTSLIAENDGRLRGQSGGVFAGPGIDLNADGDLLDTVRVYSPSNTKTYRYGVTASLIYDLDENQTIRAAYTLDYGLHRQTGEMGPIDPAGNPLNVFAGMKGPKIYGVDSGILRTRDRKSIAKLNQFSISYNGSFFDDRFKVALGVRAPYFERELNQNCYSQNGSSNVLCTTQAVAATLANGNVQFLNGNGTLNTTQYIQPYSATLKYDDWLPNVGLSYEVAENHIIFASYAEGLSAPRTDSLYQVNRTSIASGITFSRANPETTQSFDLGYRYQGDDLTISTSIWRTKYFDRIVNTFDDELGFFVDRNVGDVDLQGWDFEAAYTPVDGLTLYGSVSYIDSELQQDLILTATQTLRTKGKQLVETPEWTVSGRVQYVWDNFTFGLQGKYVGDRFSTDINDEIAPNFTVFDADIRYDLAGFGYEETYIQFNAINLFDKNYLGNISTATNALPTDVSNTNVPNIRAGQTTRFSVGAPQTFQVSVGVKF
jgi:iron complex outermembrane receptor protein